MTANIRHYKYCYYSLTLVFFRFIYCFLYDLTFLCFVIVWLCIFMTPKKLCITVCIRVVRLPGLFYPVALRRPEEEGAKKEEEETHFGILYSCCLIVGRNQEDWPSSLRARRVRSLLPQASHLSADTQLWPQLVADWNVCVHITANERTWL